ncbi:hypothetical protein [Clostridium sp. FS41]|uniref:hypothetical protein n=1 Tax=Clostridium sp. FS41 TaxID=1609975 RepID=UPI0005D42D7A|nr:hypothetical protein [Clostridium sp. FS41]KJJ66858.1 hypothetical protein CLFS41_50320 [Clostridium sp. FS41]
MHYIKFDSFGIEVTDYLLDDNWLVIDASLATKEEFDKFKDFHLQHHLTNENLLNFTLDDTSYCGSLGAYTYDIEYNIRLYVSTIPFKESLSEESVFSFNLQKVLENHEQRLTAITKILKRNNLLSEDEALDLLPYLPIDHFIFAMHRQVPNLNKYLLDTHSTLEELRKK